jgi:hypothetical protein
MKRDFKILVSLRTPSGFNTCAEYSLGSGREFAESVFGGLKGRKDVNNNAVLHLDLLESVDDVPVRIKTVSCTLGELSANCQYIIRELFRLHLVNQTMHASALTNTQLPASRGEPY